jgi:SlyX protein
MTQPNASKHLTPDAHHHALDTLVDQRLVDLEIKASYNDDLLEQLNQVIIRQQAQIDALIHEVLQLKHTAPPDASGQARNLRDDLPPHF